MKARNQPVKTKQKTQGHKTPAGLVRQDAIYLRHSQGLGFSDQGSPYPARLTIQDSSLDCLKHPGSAHP